MKTITQDQYIAEAKAQGVPREHVAHICPMCKTVQSVYDLIQAGAGSSIDEVAKYEGFSCIGRFTGASTPREKPDGNPCNWTLGGLFQTHKLEVVGSGGRTHPRFELATPEEARAHFQKAMEPQKIPASN